MANNIYNKSNTISKNGTKLKTSVETTSNVTALQRIFGGQSIDLKSKGVTVYNLMGKNVYNSYKQTTKSKTNLSATDVLSKQGFYHFGQTTLKSVALNGVNFNNQQGNKTSGMDGVIKAWNNIKNAKTKKTGALYVFDTETIGGTSVDRRWGPAALTEFAIRKHDFITSQETSTNIILANNQVMSALDDMMKQYKDFYDNGNMKAIKNQNDLYVTAMRLSLYDDVKGANLVFNAEKGYYEAKQLVDTKDAAPLDYASVKRGYENFKRMNKKMEATKDKSTGLTNDAIAFIKATGELQQAITTGNGYVAGHNIYGFDRAVVEQQLNGLVQQQYNILNNAKSTDAQKAQATNALNLINKSFGNSHVGLTFEKGRALDTMTASRMAQDKFGAISVLGANGQIDFNEGTGYGSKSNALETITGLFYRKEASEGVAHIADFDVKMNMGIILNPSEKLNGKSYIEHIMDGIKGGLSNNAKDIKELNNTQLFKANSNYLQSQFSGKGFLNFIQYHNENMDTYTNGGYRLSRNSGPEFTEFTGATGFNKNTFYQLGELAKYKVEDLPEEMKKEVLNAYPEYNSEYIYSASFNSVEGVKGKVGHTVSVFTASQDELEGIISSNLTHVANQTKDGGWEIVESNRNHLDVVAVKNGKAYINKPKGKTATEQVNSAIKTFSEMTSSDRARRSVLESNSSVKKIHDVLEFNDKLKDAGLLDKVNSAINKGVSMSEILTSSEIEGLDKKQHQQIKDIFLSSAGFKDKKTGKVKIDHRTVQNLGYAYDYISGREDYYKKVIAEVENSFGIKNGEFKNYWYANSNKRNSMNDFFTDLDEKLRVNVASTMSKDPNEIKRIAKDRKKVSLSTKADIENRYDFSLGKRFARLGTFGDKVIDEINNTTQEDIVTFNIGNPNGINNFVNSLYKNRMGDFERHNMRPEDIQKHKNQAVKDFFMDVLENKNKHKELFEHEDFKKFAYKLRDDIDFDADGAMAAFDSNQALDLLARAVQSAKSKNINAGNLKNSGSSFDIKDKNKTFTDKLNNIALDAIHKEKNNMRTTIDVKEKDLKALSHEVLKHFTVSDKEIMAKVGDMDDIHLQTLKFIKQDIDEKLETRLEDIFKTCQYFGITPMYDARTNQLVVEQNGKAQVLSALPKLMFGNDGRTLVAQTGNSQMGLHPTLAWGEKGAYLTTNLDENFGKKDYIYNGVLRHSNNNEAILPYMNKTINLRKQHLKESTRYTGIKSDELFMNFKFDTQDGVTGAVKYYLQHPEEMDELELVAPQAIKQLKKHKSQILNNGEIPADIYQAILPDIQTMMLKQLDMSNSNYRTATTMITNMNAGVKDVAFSKGTYLIGKRRVGTQGNIHDNVGRPPMYGIGNIYFLDKNKIEKAKDNNFVMSHSLIESAETMRMVHRSTVEGELTSDISYRQLYMAAPMIEDTVKKHTEQTLDSRQVNNKTLNKLDKARLKQVIGRTNETIISHTHEQARVMDARVFNNITNMPMNSQYFSNNLDIMNAFEDSRKDEEKAERLLKVFGSIEISNNEVKYSSSKGTLVKKGEGIAKYVGFGGVNGTLGSKADIGVLNFGIRGANDLELTDDVISSILTRNIDLFENIENDLDRKKMMVQILQGEGLKLNYRVNNINSASLPKWLSGGSEKGMTLVLQAATGELNEENALFFDVLKEQAEKAGLDSKKYDFTNGKYRLTDEAIGAAIEDVRNAVNKKNSSNLSTNEFIEKISGSSGFKTITDLLENINDERNALSEYYFGKGGAFEGVVSLVNDNIPKHGNIGSHTVGQFSEAVALLGKQKYNNGKGFSEESFNKALEEVVGLINADDSLNFYRTGPSTKNSVGRKLTIQNGTVIVGDIKDGDIQTISNDNFMNLMHKINDLIIGDKDPNTINESDKLVHNNIMIPDGKGGWVLNKDEIIGSIATEVIDGKTYFKGGYNLSNNVLVRDGETVSGVTNQFITSRRFLEAMKDKVSRGADLTDEERAAFDQHREYVAAVKDSVKYMKLDDQAMAVLEQYNLSDETGKELTAELKLKNSSFTMDKAKRLQELTGGKISVSDDGTVNVNGYGMKNTNEYLLKELRDSRFYSGTKGGLLTEEDLEKDEYAHLKSIYNTVVKGGYAPRLGKAEAQEIFDLKQIDAAAAFSRGDISVEELVQKGFSVQSIQEFTGTGGSSNSDMMGSILNKHTIIDLGEEFGDGNNRYIALPGTGQIVGSEEVRDGWLREMDKIKNNMNILEDMEGAGKTVFDLPNWNSMTQKQREQAIDDFELNKEMVNKRFDIMANIQQSIESISNMTNAYVKKDKLYTEYSKVNMYLPQSRLKITSLTGDVISKEALAGTAWEGMTVDSEDTFLKKAMIVSDNGEHKSLHALQEEGIYYDFKRVGREEFEKAGYFSEEIQQKMGMNIQELEEYYQTYGTATIDTRYPQIKEGSLLMSRTYYDPTLNGQNVASMASHTMYKVKGDSDGDSLSYANLEFNGLTMAEFEHKQMSLINNGLTGKELEKQMREEIGDKTYEQFSSIRNNMAKIAATENADLVKDVVAMQAKDIRSNLFTGTSLIKYNDGEETTMAFELKNAASKALGKNRLSALEMHPQSTDIVANTKAVDAYIKRAFEENAEVFSEEFRGKAEKIASGELSIAKATGESKYRIIDQALSHLENTMEGAEYDEMEKAMFGRVKLNQYFEEEASKGGKGAIASVNTALYSLKVAGKKIFGSDVMDEFYDQTKAGVIGRLGYQVEEQIISYKKVAAELGDTRLLDMEDMLRKLKAGKGGDQKMKNDLAQWLNTYVDEDTTANIFDAFSSQDKLKMQENNTLQKRMSHIASQLSTPVKEEELKVMAQNSIIADTFMDSLNEISKTEEGQNLLKVISYTGRKGSSAENLASVTNVSTSTMSGEMLNIVRDVTKTEADNIQEASRSASKQHRQIQEYVKDLDAGVLESAAETIATRGPSITGIGVAALGVSAALMAIGYAGGGHSRPTRPVDDTQPAPQSVSEFFDQQPSTVTPMDNRGYVINIKADTKKGERHMKRAMKEAIQASAGGGVSVNMNYRTTRTGGYSNKDIEDLLSNYI